ncbi:hypothetical protein [Candidatus Manganitrophus noduliformans]|uniref:Uncharacterized protein n=1 Tax=Candidatus Manganitrophus noduliformans TaxID=2606439 RepID=A0A7X6DQJ9_9BACT|nr:hypothetical protein [Candidatus Manganitrophus noduliformans]NKE71253.1 hypothetical protein [Candidatus Manganitrophus noduliformans]
MPTKELALPSGMIVKVKGSRFQALTLMNIPIDSLQKILESGTESTPEGIIQAVPVIRQLLELVKSTVAAPKIVDGPAENENEISLSDIPDSDMEALILYVVQGRKAEHTAGESGPTPVRSIEGGKEQVSPESALP